jgi:hypothetical protein
MIMVMVIINFKVEVAYVKSSLIVDSNININVSELELYNISKINSLYIDGIKIDFSINNIEKYNDFYNVNISINNNEFDNTFKKIKFQIEKEKIINKIINIIKGEENEEFKK